MPCPSPLLLQEYLDRELDALRGAEIAAHLEICDSCREMARGLTATSALLGTLAEVPPASLTRLTARCRPAMHPGIRLRRLIWPLAAAFGLTAAFLAWRSFAPYTSRNDFIAAFVEAHNTAASEEQPPEPCDFGLGGGWQ